MHSPSPDEEELWQFRDELECGLVDFQYARKPYKAPFKVKFLQWCPTTEVLAVASEKGDIMVKRQGWKRGWKVNVEDLSGPLFDKQNGTKISCIQWSPCGEVLVVGTNNGFIHMLDLEAGVLMFSWRISQDVGISKIRWQMGNPRYRMEAYVFDARKPNEGTPPLMGYVVKEDLLNAVTTQPPPDEHSVDRLNKAQKFVPIFHKNCMGTYMLVVLEDLSIHVLIGGVLRIAVVTPPDDFFKKHKLTVVEIDDVTLHYDECFHSLLVAYTSHGKAPEAPTGRTFGDPEVRNAQRMSSPVAQTHLLCVRPKGMDLPENLAWILACRFVNLYVASVCARESFESVGDHWKHEIKKYAEKFTDDKKRVEMADLLIVSLICGRYYPECYKHLHQIGIQGAEELRAVIEKKLSDVVRVYQSSLISSLNALSFHMARWAQEFETVMYREQSDGDALLFPEGNQDVLVYPFGEVCDAKPDPLYESMIKDATILETAARRGHGACQVNLRELTHLTRWISHMEPLFKQNKLSILRSYRLYDFSDLLKYTAREFLPEDEAKVVCQELFEMQESLAERIFDVEPLDLTNKDEEVEGVATVGGDHLLPFQKTYSADSDVEIEALLPPRQNLLQVDSSRQPKKFNPDRCASIWEATESVDPICPITHPSKWTGTLSNEASILGFSDYNTGEIIPVAKALERCFDTIRKVFSKMSEKYEGSSTIWVLELASGSEHTGFKDLQITEIKFGRKKDPIGDELYFNDDIRDSYNGSISIGAVSNNNSAHYWIKSSVKHMIHRKLPDMEFYFDTPLPTKTCVYCIDENIDARSSQKSYQYVRSEIKEEEPNVIGDLVSIERIIPRRGAYFMAVCTFRLEDGTERVKLCKSSPLHKGLIVQENGICHEDIELIDFSPANTTAAIVTECGHRVVWFEVQPRP